MFDEAFVKLKLDEVAAILDAVNKQINGSIFDPLETTILAIDVPYYKDYRFLSIADHATNPPLQRYAFQKEETQDITIIDWTYKTIYKLNEEAPITLDDKNVIEYIRFFFSYVKGRHGRFIVCESADNIRWKDEPPIEVRAKLNETLHPLEIKNKQKDGTYEVKSLMMLKDALFGVDIYVKPTGMITMSDHEILMENIPVLDSVLGQ